jgi:phage terminase small subunit
MRERKRGFRCLSLSANFGISFSETIEDEVIETTGRYGRQLKLHPAVRQINAARRRWLRLANLLGLTPRGEKALIGRKAKINFSPSPNDEFFKDPYQ